MLLAEQDLLAAGTLDPGMVRGRRAGRSAICEPAGSPPTPPRSGRRAPCTAAASDAANASTRADHDRASGGHSSTTRAMALPTITASANVATAAACSGVEIAEADADRQRRQAPRPSATSVSRFCGQRRRALRSRRSPRRSRRSRARARSTRAHARERARRREQEDDVEPVGAARPIELVGLLGRQVDAQDAVDARPAGVGRESLGAVAEDRIVVAEQDDRHVRDPRRNSATASRQPRSDAPPASARSAARCRTGPSAIGSENGTPISMRSAPARSSASRSGTVTPGSGSPTMRKGTKAASPRLRRLANARATRPARQPVASHSVTPRYAATVSMSLSPRPERLTTMIWSRERRREPRRVGDGVRALERRDDALGLGEQLAAPRSPPRR